MPQDPIPRIAEERAPLAALVVDSPAGAVLNLLRVYPSATYYSIALRIFGLNSEAYATCSRAHKDIVWQTLLELEDEGLITLRAVGTIYRTDGVQEPMIAWAQEARRRFTPRYERSQTPCNETYEGEHPARKPTKPRTKGPANEQ